MICDPLACDVPGHVTFSTDNALILGDPWFRQFVIFHDLRHHEITDKTNNVSGARVVIDDAVV